MTEKHKGRYNTAVIRMLPHLNARHPDARGTILIHGTADDTEPYVEIAQSFDFKFARSATCAEFRRQIEAHPYLLLLMIIGDMPDQNMKNAISQACERIDPMYLLHITTKSGDIPDTDGSYKCFIHHKDIVPGDEAVKRASDNTLRLLQQANADYVKHGPPPEYMNPDSP